MAVKTLVQFVACSADRTLVVRRSESGHTELMKLFERGSLADAETEATLGGLLRVPGLVQYGGAGRDAETGRPYVVMDYHPGVDLERWVAAHGPPSTLDAVRIGERLARTLAAMHALRTHAAPQGFAHCDVKPSNVLLVGGAPDPSTCDVVLLDAEHATPIGARESRAFSGGTHAFAPPEAHTGTAPTAAFDAFAFGATLHALLTGVSSRARGDALAVAGRALRGQPRTLRRLVDACVSPQPEQRPTLAAIADTLAAFLAAPPTGLPALTALQRGDLVAAETLADEADDDELDELRLVLAQRRRLCARVARPVMAPEPVDPDRLSGWLAAAAPRVTAWLRRFPSDAQARTALTQARRALARLLQAAPQRIAELKRIAAFERAQTLIDHATRALQLIGRPGLDDAPNAPTWPLSPQQRDPLRWVAALRNDVQQAARSHEQLIERLRAAESRLDLRAAAAVLDTVAAVYTGANEMVAALKDRVHRLGFYCERLAQPLPALDQLRDQLALAVADIDLAPVHELQHRGIAAIEPVRVAATTARPASLRSFRRALQDLVAEYPHLADCVDASRSALDAACSHLTDACWQLLAEGQQKLNAVPVPIRPLQSVVNRIDTLRLLDVLVDRPDRTRARLLDELERLRLRVDQARSTRDRLARGAEEAFRKGHITTALYDLERAAGQFAEETGEMREDGQRVAAQIEAAKRAKQQVTDAAAHNVRLATQAMQLQDDPSSTHAQRLAVLEERRVALQLLVDGVPSEQAESYRQDLRDVEVAILLERAADAEARLDASSNPSDREHIAASTAAMLRDADSGDTRVGRVMRAIEHWEHLSARARRELRQRETVRAGAAHHARQRRRRTLQIAMACLTVIGLLYFASAVRGQDPVDALAALMVTPLPTATPDALDQLAARLASAETLARRHPELGELVVHASRIATGFRTQQDIGPALDDYARTLRELAAALPDSSGREALVAAARRMLELTR